MTTLDPPLLASSRRRAFPVVDLPNTLTLLFLFFCGYLIAQHGLWRDEALAFLIARDAHSLSDLFRNLRYEGHPPLWHLMLFVVTRFTVAPGAIQVLHLLLAAATVQLVTRFAPFPRVVKILFPFGYYTLFEYGVLARNYQLFLLLSMLFCVLWSRHRRAYLGFGSILGLLCFSHVLGVILAAAFGTLILYEAAVTRWTSHRWRTIGPAFLMGAALAILSAVLAIQLLIPPPDSGVITGWHFGYTLGQIGNTLTAFWDAYVPIPAFQLHFWGKNFFPTIVTGAGGGVLAALILCAVFPCRRAFWFLLVADVGTAAFLHAKIFNGWRHVGPLFVALVAAVWIASVDRPSRTMIASRRSLLFKVLGIILTIHVASLAIACSYLAQYPFSAGRAAAAFLRPQLTGHELLVAKDDFAITAVGAYLPDRSFFYQRGSRWGTFTISNAAFSRHNSLWWATLFARERHVPVILIYGEPLSRLPPNLTYLGGFDNVIQPDDYFYLYRLSPPAPATRPVR